eukprot:803174-Prymnesium_polylepis.1
MLASDGNSGCLRATSNPELGSILTYLFMLIGVLMMVNMLIAMMAKTMDTYQGSTLRTPMRTESNATHTPVCHGPTAR